MCLFASVPPCISIAVALHLHVCFFANSASRMALIKACFPDTDLPEQEKMLERLLSTSSRKQSFKSPVLRDVLNLLEGDDDAKQFAELKLKIDDEWRSDFLVSRVGRAKGQAESLTPVMIKGLKPPGPKIYLCWQLSTSTFEGYYPRSSDAIAKAKASRKNPGARVKTHFTTSKTYGGVKNLSQFDALSHVVRFLWGHHQRQGGVPLPLLWNPFLFQCRYSTL